MADTMASRECQSLTESLMIVSNEMSWYVTMYD